MTVPMMAQMEHNSTNARGGTTNGTAPKRTFKALVNMETDRMRSKGSLVSDNLN